MKTFQLKIITPERILFDEMVNKVSLPTVDGEITVLSNHIPIISLLKAGEITIVKDEKVIPLVISGGFTEVTAKRLLVMADTAEHIEELDEERALEAQKRAKEQLNEKQLDAKDYAYLVAKIDKEFARVRISQKYRKLRK